MLLASVIVFEDKSKDEFNFAVVTALSTSLLVPTEPSPGFTVCKASPKNTQYIVSEAPGASDIVRVVPEAVCRHFQHLALGQRC